MFFPQREQKFINPPITNIPPLYKRIIIFRGRVCGHITPYQVRKVSRASKTRGKPGGRGVMRPTHDGPSLPKLSLTASGKYVNNTLVTVWPVKNRYPPGQHLRTSKRNCYEQTSNKGTICYINDNGARPRSLANRPG